MVEQIIWTKTAIEDKIAIFEFWNTRNGNNSFSRKLNISFDKCLNLLKNFPKIGVNLNFQSTRAFYIKEYAIIYKIINNNLVVMRIWHSKQNPELLKID